MFNALRVVLSGQRRPIVHPVKIVWIVEEYRFFHFCQSTHHKFQILRTICAFHKAKPAAHEKLPLKQIPPDIPYAVTPAQKGLQIFLVLNWFRRIVNLIDLVQHAPAVRHTAEVRHPNLPTGAFLQQGRCFAEGRRYYIVIRIEKSDIFST